MKQRSAPTKPDILSQHYRARGNTGSLSGHEPIISVKDSLERPPAQLPGVVDCSGRQQHVASSSDVALFSTEKNSDAESSRGLAPFSIDGISNRKNSRFFDDRAFPQPPLRFRGVRGLGLEFLNCPGTTIATPSIY